MTTPLPKNYAWLAQETAPKLLLEVLKWHGLREVAGTANSPDIMRFAQQMNAASYYKSDATPWCALFLAACAKAAGYNPPPDPLRALSWAKFGVAAPGGVAMLGDVLVMARNGGGHVTLYVGETATHYAGLGGNQGDAVSIVLFPKSRITAIRRSPFKIGQPTSVRRIPLNALGTPVSEREV